MTLSLSLPRTYFEALRFCRKILKASPELQGRSLVEPESEQLVIEAIRFTTGVKASRIDLYTKMTEPYPLEAAEKLLEWSSLRVKGVPLQHLTGIQTFLNHDYEVGPDVLIPRPETEGLVASAIDMLEKEPASPQLGFEVGIGCGIISIELLSHFRNLRMVSSEFSEGARERAMKNASRILGHRFSESLRILSASQESHVWQPFEEFLQERSTEPVRFGSGSDLKADFLISNPPYLLGNAEVDAEVAASEPAVALFAPIHDPLFYYREFAKRATDFIRPSGFVFLEIPHERAAEISSLFKKVSEEVSILKDLNQRERVLIARIGVRKNG